MKATVLRTGQRAARNVTVLPADRLTADHVEAWSRLQRADPAVASPFFRPEFTRAVASVRGDVEVAVLEEGGEPVGFFPFQRGWWEGRPVGGRLSDYHGLVARWGLEWAAAELLRACRLRAWRFDHLVASQQPFHRYHYGTGGSPYIDLSKGFAAYEAERKAAGSEVIHDALRKMRRLEREVGPLRFEPHSDDPRAFAVLLEWKSAQYRRTRATDVFAFGWTVRLLERILRECGEAFAGMLSTLYVGDRVAAVEFGLRSHGVLHAWFPAYNPSLARYSPGLIHQVLLAKAAPSLGIRCLDLGKGPAPFKERLMSGAFPLAEGAVALHPLAGMVRRAMAPRAVLGAHVAAAVRGAGRRAGDAAHPRVVGVPMRAALESGVWR